MAQSKDLIRTARGDDSMSVDYSDWIPIFYQIIRLNLRVKGEAQFYEIMRKKLTVTLQMLQETKKVNI